MGTEERIQAEMFATRASLAEKLETLEQKVTGTVDQMATAVQDTVGVIQDSVQEAKATVSAVNESVQEGVKSVKESLDVSVHVQAHPWMAVAGSIAAGFCLGALLKNRAESRSNFTADGVPLASNGFAGSQRRETGIQISPPQAERSMWAPEIDKLKGLALGALFGAAREMVTSSLPDPVGQQVKDMIDSVTIKAGGEPIPSSAFANLLQPTAPRRNDVPPRQKEFRRVVPVEVGGEA